MTYELDRLRRWKKEAKQVFMEWEKVWEALGSPGILGQSKAVAAAEEVERMRLDRDNWKRRCTAETRRRKDAEAAMHDERRRAEKAEQELDQIHNPGPRP